MLALNRNHFSSSADSLPSIHSPYYNSERELNIHVLNWLSALKTCSISASPESWGAVRELYERIPDFSKEDVCDEVKCLLDHLSGLARHDFVFDPDLHQYAEKAYQAVCSSGEGYDPSFWAEKDPTPQRTSPCARVCS
ncbi:MAG TPA: hypothetical protein DCE71_05805 [Parachlamydiales bacterium]|nr:hypothetical protein [Parachlamydiales bacterium]